jgi:hypothetical protein
MGRRYFDEEDTRRAARILRGIRIALQELRQRRQHPISAVRTMVRPIDDMTELWLEVQLRLVEKWLAGERRLPPGPRSPWQRYFEHWQREVDKKDRTFADIARAWEVPETKINTARRDFDRWRSAKRSRG